MQQLTAVNIKTPEDPKPHPPLSLPPETPPRPNKDHWIDKSPVRVDKSPIRVDKSPMKVDHEIHNIPNNGTLRNGTISAFGGSRENMLAKTDVAMANLLVRLDQVAAQCSAAQVHGGGSLMCEEKFQVSFKNNK